MTNYAFLKGMDKATKSLCFSPPFLHPLLCCMPCMMEICFLLSVAADLGNTSLGQSPKAEVLGLVFCTSAGVREMSMFPLLGLK